MACVAPGRSRDPATTSPGRARRSASPPSPQSRAACPDMRPDPIRFDVTPPDRDPARMHDDDLPEEPRVPGGPLAIGGLHPLAWIFILLALVDLVWFIVNSDSAQITSLADAALYGLQVFPAVAAILFPAALLARHPDAATRAPVLLLGTVLF